MPKDKTKGSFAEIWGNFSEICLRSCQIMLRKALEYKKNETKSFSLHRALVVTRGKAKTITKEYKVNF